jgi:hypothetical protein
LSSGGKLSPWAVQNEKQEWFRYSLLGCLTSEEKRVNILEATPWRMRGQVLDSRKCDRP